MKLPKNAYKQFISFKDFYGSKLLFIQAGIYILLWGLVVKSAELNIIPYFREDLDLDLVTKQRFSAAIHASCGLQAWVAIASEIFPLFGVRKSYYMAISLILGVFSLLMVAFVDLSKTPYLAPVFLLFAYGGGMCCVLLINLLFLELLEKETKHKVAMITWVSLLLIMSSLVSSHVGVTLKLISSRYIFLVCFVSTLPVLFPLLFRFLPEERIKIHKIKTIKREKKSLILAFTIGLMSLILFSVAIWQNEIAIIVFVFLCAPILIGLTFRLLDKAPAKKVTYAFLHSALTFEKDITRFEWYQVEKQCLNKGALLSRSYTMSYSQIIGFVFSLLTIFASKKILDSYKSKKIYLFSTIFRFLCFMPEVFVIFRFVPALDEFFFSLSGDILQGTHKTMTFMAMMLLLTESPIDIFYSIIVLTIHGFGYAYSKIISAMILQFLGYATSTLLCNAKVYLLISILSHLFGPIVCVIPLFFMLKGLTI